MLTSTEGGGMDRRGALASLALAGLAGATAAGSAGAAQPQNRAMLTPEQLGWDASKGEYVLPPLPYPYEALEPFIDAQTMRLHHDKHHAGYVRGLNTALSQLAKIRAGEGDLSLVKHWSREVSFHGSGHTNHVLFWEVMAPPGAGGGGEPTGDLAAAIERDFGSYSAFAAHFKAASVQVEASGWGWLVYHPAADRLLILQGEKQQDLTVWGVLPILGVDVWEHAYYLKYQNRRAEYVDAFMQVVNWSRAADFYRMARDARPTKS